MQQLPLELVHVARQEPPTYDGVAHRALDAVVQRDTHKVNGMSRTVGQVQRYRDGAAAAQPKGRVAQWQRRRQTRLGRKHVANERRGRRGAGDSRSNIALRSVRSSRTLHQCHGWTRC